MWFVIEESGAGKVVAARECKSEDNDSYYNHDGDAHSRLKNVITPSCICARSFEKTLLAQT